MDIKINHDFKEIFFVTYKNFNEITHLCNVEHISIPNHPVSIFELVPSTDDARNYPYQFTGGGDFTVGSKHITERIGRPDYQLILTEKGHAFVQYEDDTYSLKPGTVMFIDCNKYHKYWVPSNSIWQYKHLHFSTEYPQILTSVPVFLENPPQVKPIFDELFAYLRSLKFATSVSPYIYSNYISDILTRMITADFLNSNDTNLKFERVLKYIQKHYNEPIKIDFLANQIGYSESHFIRKFKKYFSITPHQYITQCRITNVHNKILDGDTVQNAALSCGFNSASAFYYSSKKQNAK